MTQTTTVSNGAQNRPLYLTGYTIAMHIRGLLLAALILFPISSSAATLYMNPTAGTYGLSDTFISEVRIDNQSECVNAAQVEVRYPTESLRAVDFSKGNSILSLWIEEPKIDIDNGTVTFAGGIPGGYCGRIPGDPVLSNVLGKIVFSVVGAEQKSASISISDSSVVYLNDGAATKADLSLQSAEYSIQPTPQSASNPWLQAVGEDKIPPDEFVITVESTRGVFRGNFYAVFATQDKQSGLDHYEIYERGAWQTVRSPHELRDQRLVGGVQIKAIDKAGNERLGSYVEGSAAPRVPHESDYSVFFVLIGALMCLGAYMWYRERSRKGASGSA